MRNHPARLAALQRLMILDSAPERDYDALAGLFARTLGVPIAMVNLLDRDRDWFKACTGLDTRQSPTSTSFCEAFFGSDDGIILAPDTSVDPRFHSHPLVTGAPFIRIYAAVRLAVDGHTVGTLCAYDLQPRQVSAEQVAQLQLLASEVAGLLQLRQHAA